MNTHLGFDSNFNIHKVSGPKKKVEKNNDFNIAKNINIGYYLITPMIFGIFFGLFLDKLLKTGKIFFIILFSVGIIGTFYNLYKIYKDD